MRINHGADGTLTVSRSTDGSCLRLKIEDMTGTAEFWLTVKEVVSLRNGLAAHVGVMKKAQAALEGKPATGTETGAPQTNP